MEQNQSRRDFLEKCVGIGGFCALLHLFNENLIAQDSTKSSKKVNEFMDLKSYAYCGILCEKQCELFVATKNNDVELKKKVYETWKWKDKFGFDFDPEKVFCYTCKPGKLPLKPGMKECGIRICAMKNSMQSCIQCKGLTSCKQAFWKEWPKMYKYIIELQQQYTKQKGAKLLNVRKA
jgi:hypothetical protein